MHEYQHLEDAVQRAREARQAHVREVMTVEYDPDASVEDPPEVLDAAWLTEYRRLREVEDEAQRVLDEYLKSRYTPTLG